MIQHQQLFNPIGGFCREAPWRRAHSRSAGIAWPDPIQRLRGLCATLTFAGLLTACGGGAVFIGDGVNATLNVPPGNLNSNGTEVLSVVFQEPAGRNCERGGSRVDSGVDYNRNQVLEASEIQTTRYVCNA